MPRGHKSKGRSRAKRQQARGEGQNIQEAQPPAEEEVAQSPPTGQVGQDGPLGSDHASTSYGAASPGSRHAGRSCTGSNVDAQGSAVDVSVRNSSASQEGITTHPICPNVLTRKVTILMMFLLEKFKVEETFTEGDMLNVITVKYKAHFPDILRKTSARIEMVFGLEVKHISRTTHTYIVVSKLGLTHAEILSCNKGLPKMGLLMTILGLIFAKGNRATHTDVWGFLSMFGVYAGRDHFIFGDPQNLITKELVQKNYLEIRQVPGSDPPRYDFLWGSQSYIETSKMKVLEVWAKIHDVFPSSFPKLYEEALRDQAERAENRAAALGCPMAMARLQRRCKSHSSSKN